MAAGVRSDEMMFMGHRGEELKLEQPRFAPFRESPRQTHVTERLSVQDDQSAIQARAVQQPGISFFFYPAPRDQSEASMWLCCHGKHDRDVKKCQTS